MRTDDVFEEIISLQPALSSLGGRDDFIQLISNLEDYYSQPIFQNSPTQSDLQILTGTNNVLIDDSSNTISLFESSESFVEIYSGTHDLLVKDSELAIEHHSGSTSLYLENLQEAKLELNIREGEISIDNKDEFTLIAPAQQQDANSVADNEAALAVGDQLSNPLSETNTSHSDSIFVVDEKLTNIADILFEDDLVINRLPDEYDNSISVNIPNQLPTDVFLSEQIDLIIQSTEDLADENAGNIEIAQMKIAENIQFDSDYLISVEGYTDMVFEDAIQFIDDI